MRHRGGQNECHSTFERRGEYEQQNITGRRGNRKKQANDKKMTDRDDDKAREISPSPRTHRFQHTAEVQRVDAAMRQTEKMCQRPSPRRIEQEQQEIIGRQETTK